MRRLSRRPWGSTVLLATTALAACARADEPASPNGGAPPPGLSVTFTALDAAKTTDRTVLPNVWLYIPQGQPPTPFVPAGKLNALWTGSVTSDSATECAFQAELNGSLTLELNGQLVLEAATNGATALTRPVPLHPGTNALTARFSSPDAGDAFIRLRWQPKGSIVQPIPLDALTRSADTPESVQAAAVHLGRELFLEYRCAKCHAVAATDTSAPELGYDAPAFDDIGARRNYDWMARWIQDPKSLRPTAHMPKVLHGPQPKEQAESIAAWLASLRPATTTAAVEPDAAQSSLGPRIFDNLHCAACHNAPDATETDPAKLPLNRVREKFAPGALAEFLQKPGAHYAWIRMPDFHLTTEEAARLAGWLDSAAAPSTTNAPPTDAAVIKRGRELAQSSGCLNCHALKLDNQFKATPLADLKPDRWNRGCLAETPDDAGKAPVFSFGTAERAALRAFGATDRSALARFVPAEFAERQTRLLNCRECHGKFEGFPAFDILGAKLRPEWSVTFISGALTNKQRTWLDARMPAFPKPAAGIAQGLAMLHGYPPQTPPEPPVDMQKAAVGQKLVSMAGGMSCVTCHGVGDRAPAQMTEGAGVNFALTAARVRKDWARRWIRNPQLIDLATKMPLYFDEHGKSPLTDFYGGDGAQQIDAIWEYIRLGDKMPPPPTP